MPGLLTLETGEARLVLAPALGGGIAQLDCGAKPVLRRWSGDPNDGPFALASNVLVPFSNRISGGGFVWENVHHPIEQNLPGEACPIHGDGFQRRWQVSDESNTRAVLSLDDGQIGPWRYRAEQTLALAQDALKVGLQVTNTGSVALPFGFGFHPWFPRNKDTRLEFQATGVWLEDDQYLPTKRISLVDTCIWNFDKQRSLPEQWINNAYTDWAREALITQGDEFVSTRITASNNLNCVIVHSVDADCEFLCVEPVSHAVDAINKPGALGMTVLEPGETAKCWIKLDWNDRD